MPRNFVFSDGRNLVQIDPYGTLRDLCVPIGTNHLCGRPIRFGVGVDHQFSWCDDTRFWSHTQSTKDFDFTLGYEIWESVSFGLRVEVTNWLENGVFHRKFVFYELNGRERTIGFFVNEQLQVEESDVSNGVCWHAPSGSMMHYKNVCFSLNTLPVADQWSCGLIGHGRFNGTGDDALDCELSMNPVSQGSVDSTTRTSLHLEAHSQGEIRFQIRLDRYPATPATWPEVPTPTARDEKGFHLGIVHTHVSGNGAILASSDSDIMASNRTNYAYCWPRDGAHIAETFLDAGDSAPALKYAKFAQECLVKSGVPYFFQKYMESGAVACGWHPFEKDGKPIYAIQEDETASVVSLACRMHREGLLDASLFEDLIVKPACFLRDAVDERGLPQPSFDLWEERFGVHVYTVACVIKALRDAAEFVEGCEAAAEKMLHAFLEVFWDEGRGSFLRRLDEYGNPDTTVDASSLQVGLLGVLPPEDSRVKRNAEKVREMLWVHTEMGGIARYSGDWYCRVNDNYPGNPWFICTLWLAQYEALLGNKEEAERLVNLCRMRQSSTGMMAEQWHPETGEPMSVMPLMWSHAEMAKTLMLLEKMA